MNISGDTHTTFSLTLTVSPGLPKKDEGADLAYSIMDAMTETYLKGLQDYLEIVGIQATLKVTIQRCDYTE